MSEMENVAPATTVPDGYEEFPNGDRLYTVVTEYSEITCRFNHEKIKSLLKEMMGDLFKKARTQEADFELTVPGQEARTLVEIKHRSVQRLAGDKMSEKEIQEEINLYAEEAYRMFSGALNEKLLHAPQHYIIETMAATVASLDKKGVLRTRMRSAPFYKELTEALLQKFKARWVLPTRGRPRLVRKRMKEKFGAYYRAILLIVRAEKNAKSRRVNKTLQEKARKAKALAEVEQPVLDQIKKELTQKISSGDLAWKITCEKYLPEPEGEKNSSRGTAHSRRILTKARDERDS